MTGIAAVIAASRANGTRRAVTLAAGAGALAMSAPLIKQNFADVAVFGAVAYVIARCRHEISGRRLLHLVTASAAGAGVVLVAVAWWTVLHGTSLHGVFDAMYPFRIRAGHVIAMVGRQHAAVRLGSLVVSVFLGGNYWLHYLVELIGPASIAVGVLAASRRPAARIVVAYAVVVAALAWGAALTKPQGTVATTVGEAVGASAHPGDTIFAAYGRANIVESSGLSSPYPYLWSLPVKTLDPHLTTLDAVLRSTRAPTYIVVWHHVSSWGLDSAATRAIIAADYHPLGRVCGHAIYLRNGLIRAALPTRCRFTSPQITSMKEYVP